MQTVSVNLPLLKSLLSLATVIEAKDPYTGGHAWRVSHYARLLAEDLGLTQDEESSGVIDASAILGEGWYLLDQQAHYATDAELVEGGQLLALHIPSGKNFK